MMEFLRTWIMGIVGASLLSAAALAVTPKGRVRNVTQMLCGVVMAISLLRPAVEFNFTAYSEGMSKYREDIYAIGGEIEETNDRLNRTIIEEECAAYILDKAQLMGMTISVSVTAKWGDEGSFVPVEVSINGSDTKRQELLALIEGELGVPPEKVYWSSSDED